MGWDDNLKGSSWRPNVRKAYRLAFDVPLDVMTNPFISGMFEIGWLMRGLTDEVRNYARNSLRIVMWREYGLMFDHVFDWMIWRDNIDSPHFDSS